MSIDVTLIKSVEPVVEGKARWLSRCRGFRAGEAEDILQDLWMHVVEKAPQFNPAITTWEKFVSFILDMRCISLIRQRRAEKRDPEREAGSLNDPIEDCDGRIVDRYQVTRDPSARTPGARDDERDIAALMARFSDLARTLALGLAFGSKNSVGEDLEISRRTVIKELRQIEEVLRAAGFDPRS